MDRVPRAKRHVPNRVGGVVSHTTTITRVDDVRVAICFIPLRPGSLGAKVPKINLGYETTPSLCLCDKLTSSFSSYASDTSGT